MSKAPFAEKISLELRIYSIMKCREIRRIYEPNKEAWDFLFQVFVERNLEAMVNPDLSALAASSQTPAETASLKRMTRRMSAGASSIRTMSGIKMVAGQPIRRFPLQANGRLRWYGRDLHPFFDVIPVQATISVNNEPYQLQNEEKFSYHPERSQIESVTIRIFSSRWMDDHEDDEEVIESRSNQEAQIIDGLFVLSCLIQYAGDVYGPGSPHSILSLRPLIMPILVNRISPSPINPSGNIKRKVWVDLDVTVVQSLLEEWLAIPVSKQSCSVSDKDKPEESRLNSAGRSTGALILGPQGIGKSYFCVNFLNTMHDIAPWMLLDPPHSKQSLNPIKFERGGVVLDGAWLVSDSMVYITADDFSIEADEAGRIGHRPLLHGEGAPDKSAPQAIRRVQKVFAMIKKWTRNTSDRMLIIVIERMDVVIASRQARSVLSQLKWEIDHSCNGIDMFVLGTCRDFLVPALDRVDRARNERYLSGFRVIKVFPCELDVAFQGILERVKSNSKLLLTGCRRHAHRQNEPFEHPGAYLGSTGFLCQKITKMIETAENHPEFRKKRQEWALLLHNMHQNDMCNLSLAVQIHLSKMIQSGGLNNVGDIDRNAAKMVIEAFDFALNAPSLINMLSPNYLHSRMFVRHDTVSIQDVRPIAKTLYERAKKDRQYLHFIKVVPPHESLEKSKSAYGNITMYSSDVSSLLHNLHEKFRFRSSVTIDAPEFCVPHHPKLSANNPIASSNPFDGFIWHNRQSCIVVNTLEQLVGFQLMPMRIYFDEKKVITRDGIGVSRSQEYRTEMGLNLGGAGSVKLDFNEARNQTMGIMTGIHRSLRAGASYNFPFSAGVDLGLSRDWARERSTGTQFAQAIDHAVSLVPSAGISVGRGEATSFSKHHVRGVENGKGEHNIAFLTRTFEQPEALTRLIVGLKSLIERQAKVVEMLDNLVLVFYSSDDCFDEVAIQRLGFPKNGVFSPPLKGCSHFSRHIRVAAPCCGKFFTCHLCHDEENKSHRMNQKGINAIQCLNCLSKQPLLNEATGNAEIACRHCSEPFGVASCGRCKLFRDDLTEGGIVHCLKCDTCYAEDYIEIHLQLCDSKK
ncbi:hypothetical protein MP638_001883 [Amoeboaphelidium occidentale]|nr:hypothetical protein MP638_001883 [Amoeboaphelidium occidentale]